MRQHNPPLLPGVRLTSSEREQAKARLLCMIEMAAREPEAFARHDIQIDLKAKHQHLAEVLDRTEAYANKNYIGLAAALAGLLELYDSAPDRYAAMLAGIAGDPLDLYPDTWRGLGTLQRLVDGLSDDHDFGWDVSIRTIRVITVPRAGRHGLSAAMLADLVAEECSQQRTRREVFR